MNKNNKLINEDLKRFKLLMEYDFYIGEDKEEYSPEGDLITEEPPEDGQDPAEDSVDSEAPMDGAEGGEEPVDGEEIPDGEVGDEVEFGGEEPEGEFGGEEAIPEPMGEPEPMEDEVELDITELVQGTAAAKASSDDANQKIGLLMQKFEELNGSLDKMEAINAKIDNMEHEFEKRNPTPEEKLEMRSLSSYPYNLKLTDYWSEKEGNYDVMKGDKEGNQQEDYVLTQEEVDSDYNAIHVKDSFTDSDENKESDNMKVRY
jgi:hypothetical protein